MYTWYLKFRNANSEYYNLRLDKTSSYLTTFACQFGRYRYYKLPSGITLAGGMF